MKYSEKERELIAIKAIKEKNIEKVSQEYGLNKSTVYRYIEKYKSDNKNRRNHLTISLTDEEYYKLCNESEAIGFSKTHYVRSVLFRRKVVAVNPSLLIKELYSLRAEVNKIGSNLNQIAHYVNYLYLNKNIDFSYVKELIEVQMEFDKKVKDLRRVIDNTFQDI